MKYLALSILTALLIGVAGCRTYNIYVTGEDLMIITEIPVTKTISPTTDLSVPLTGAK